MAAPALYHRLKTAGRELAQGLVQLFYPGACLVCGQPLTADTADFCAACRAALLADPHAACPRCAAAVGPFTPAPDCVRCRGESFAFERVVRLGLYDGPLRQAALHMKHHTGEGLAEALGNLWAEPLAARLREVRPDLVVPVPLHWLRRWRRGYNQSEAVA